MFWLLQHSLHYPYRQQLVWSSYKDSFKTAKLPIFINSPGQKHNVTFKFLSILSIVCWSSLLQAQWHTALSSQALATQGCRTILPPQFTFLTADMKKEIPSLKFLEGKKLIKTFLPLHSPPLSVFVTGKQMQWDMSYAGLCSKDPEKLTINIKTEYLSECKCLGTNRRYLFLRNSSFAFLTLLIHFIITPFPVPIFCFMEVTTGTWHSSDLPKYCLPLHKHA